MTDIEARLREAFARSELPTAPASLRDRVRTVIVAETATRDSGRPLGGSVTRVVAGLGMAVVAIVIIGLGLVGNGVTQPTSAPSALTEPPATVPAASAPTPAPTFDSITVGEALAALTAGTLGDDPVIIRGFWSNGTFFHGCGLPAEQPGELELRCVDEEFGITERPEQIFVVDQHGLVTYQARGPHLTPFIPEELSRDGRFYPPRINGQLYPPVPIVVEGHFNDPRAALCQTRERQKCLDRFVIDRVLLFDPGVVPTPGVTPSPTPFPSPGPPGLFAPEECAGDIEYSFVGWTTFEELGIDLRGYEHIWVAISRDPVDRSGEWIDDDSSDIRYRHFIRVICYRSEWQSEGVMGFTSIPGSDEVHWEDGVITPGSQPVRP